MSTTFNGDVVFNGPVTITIAGDTLNISPEALAEEQEDTCCGGYDSDTCGDENPFGDDEDRDEFLEAELDEDEEQEDEEQAPSNTAEGFLQFLNNLAAGIIEDEADEPEEDIFTVADANIIKAIRESEGDFVFDTGTPSKVHCWTINSGDTPEFVCNLGIDKLRMAMHDDFNLRLDVALTKDAAIEIRDFLNNLDLGD